MKMVEPKKLSVKEFKMWLSGVEEMQGADWSPDANQWAKIRAKIEQLNEVVEVPPQATQPYTGYRGAPPAASAPAFVPPAASAPAAGPTFQPPPSDLGAQTQVVPNVPSAPVRVAPGIPLATGQGNIPIKTPDIDTFGKPYGSSFA